MLRHAWFLLLALLLCGAQLTLQAEETASATAASAGVESAVPSHRGGAADDAEVETADEDDADEATDDEDAAGPTEALDAPGEAAPAASSGGSSRDTAEVQFMITNKMKAQLSELGYTDDETEQLAPERARAIIEKSIRRPRAGVPAAWNRGAKKPPMLGRQLLAIRSRGAALVSKAKAKGGLAGLVCLVGAGATAAAVLSKQGGVSAESVARTVEEILDDADDETPQEEGLWLDRQYDKLVAALKRMLTKGR